jgi:GR25 family glycosyltransferase involved in LPS biosynthesis
MTTTDIPKICLNMIVRNESHIIQATLENLCKYFNFDYWVIVDTGSTDATMQIIQEFFHKQNIPGELHETEWIDFGFNRSYALDRAYNKSDYLLIFDADDKIKGNLVLPKPFDADRYSLKIGPVFEYSRPLLINNRKRWKFEGVLHEYLTNVDEVHGEKTIEGDYCIISGRDGNRNRNPNKYRDDALVLERAYHAELSKNVNLAARYAFYCAQSYKDAGTQYVDNAIHWYEIAMSVCYWHQEKYYSCLMLGNLYKNKNDMMKACKYWLDTVKYDPERIEGIAYAMEHMSNSGLHVLVNLLYHKYKNYNRAPTNKLFLFKNMYHDYIEFYNSISAFYTDDRSSGYECAKKIVIEKSIDDAKYKLTLKNFAFYKHECSHDTGLSELFDLIDTRIYNNVKRLTLVQEENAAWNAIFDAHRKELTTYRPYTTRNSEAPTVFFSITSCKRLNLFKQTMNSILNQWTDIEKVDYWYCVDDNSSIEDRAEMMHDYPWFDYYMKSIDEKGHRSSMNIIWNKLQQLKPTYWIHMEDDFLFHKKMDYVTTSITALTELGANNVKQVLFNRNYSETIDDYGITGHTMSKLTNIVIHKHNHVKHGYRNCHYWPHYSFRPSMVLTSAILELGDYNSANQFFEMDYAEKWAVSRYKSAFFDRITNRHIGRLTSERHNSSLPNAYTLNAESQFIENQQNAIRVVNLKRRSDRKSDMITQLRNEHILNYDFAVATDGQSLVPSEEIYSLFCGNDFGTKRGVIGCALSHYGLWQELLKDSKNDYYLILEDDVQLAPGVKHTLDNIDVDMKTSDVIFLGYSMFANKRAAVADIYNQSTTPVKLVKLNRDLYIGGTFAYSINKAGARKLVDYIKTNGIRHGIDYMMKLVLGLDCLECQPQVVFSEWNEGGKVIDTDIQNRSDSMIFPPSITSLDNFVFLKQLDQAGNDLYSRNKTVNELGLIALNDPSCNGFNTFGYCKGEITQLVKSQYMKTETHGLYIKHSAYSRLIFGYDNTSEVLQQTTFRRMMKKQSDHITRIGFIHSCNAELNGLTILDDMIQYINDLGLTQIVDVIYIINVGIPIEYDRYNSPNIEIINLSTNPRLTETRTINILHKFCALNPDKEILYLHTKGISYKVDDPTGIRKNVDDWRNVLMYFMLDKHAACHQILQNYDVAGCNYLTSPEHHFSGNFWWATSNYINTLPVIYEVHKPNSAEFWLLAHDKVRIYELHHSNKNHYRESCAPEEYVIGQTTRPIRIKMMCNWCTSQQLCKEWSTMCENRYRWKNLEITWVDTDIDYYIIINQPPKNEYYLPEKTIVFQMEPWVVNPDHNWGVKTWGEWADPDPTLFLAVRGRKSDCHNNAFWQLELTLKDIETLTYEPKLDTVASICSSKYFDEGHIHRIDFLKFIESKGDIALDIFNQDNTHGFANYRGKVSPSIDKSKGIVPYKYYFMAENNYERNFITEKLWEPILCETLVFYYGCPNANQYIDERAYVQLDMYDFEKSYQIIKQAISEDWWSQRIEYIRAEKKKILTELAFFPTVQSIIHNASFSSSEVAE